jgi:lysozyme
MLSLFRRQISCTKNNDYTAMKISNEGIELIKRYESLRLKPYLCAAGKPTIGYGHTRTASMQMGAIEERTADKLLRTDLDVFEAQLKPILPELKQCQYDAIVSLVFNIGIGNFHKSQLSRRIENNPKDKHIADEWIEFRNSGGKYLRGLMRRRIDELKLYYSW